MQAYATAVFGRVKDPHKTLKKMLRSLSAQPKSSQPAQANAALLAAMRGLVARTNRSN